GIDMHGRLKVPKARPGEGIEGVEPVVAGAKEDLAVGDAGLALDVAAGGEVPVFPPGGCIETVELANEVGVHALADIEPAAGQAGGGQGMQHRPVVVELPAHVPRS